MTGGIIVIGASWGGMAALSTLVAGLPGDFDIPIAIVQHRSKSSDTLLAQILQDLTPLRVQEADDKDPLSPGTIHIAPPDYHLLIDRGFAALTTDAPVRFSRPSIDVTFNSAADSCQDAAVGVVLTGANEDGAQGLKRIVARGGVGIVQDPETAESPTMPRAALKAVPTATVMKLSEIGPALGKIATSRRSAKRRAG